MSRKHVYFLSVILAAYIVPLSARQLPGIARVPLENSTSPFSFDISSYRGDIEALPIGVFDSGLGGLTVLARILGLDAFDNSSGEQGADGVPDFAEERFIYLGEFFS